MIRSITIDEEPRCISALKGDLVMFCPDVEVLAGCHSAKEGLLAIKKHHPDLVFLDVEMPWMCWVMRSIFKSFLQRLTTSLRQELSA